MTSGRALEGYLLSREQVEEAYRTEAESRGWGDSWLCGTFPPMVCRELLERKDGIRDLPQTFSPARGYMSDLKGRSIQIAAGSDLAILMQGLPLDGHFGLIDRRDYYMEATASALSLISALAERYADSVSDWTSTIAWVDRYPGSRSSMITSSTFPALPHCSFVSPKAFRHIPPENISDTDTLYCLAENIFHESLHQHLSSTLIFGDYLSKDFSTETSRRIEVPWRHQSWEADRVVHATFVYLHLVDMRRTAQPILRSRFIDEAEHSGARALAYLSGRLVDCQEAFNHTGIEMIEALYDRAMHTIN